MLGRTTKYVRCTQYPSFPFQIEFDGLKGLVGSGAEGVSVYIARGGRM